MFEGEGSVFAQRQSAMKDPITYVGVVQRMPTENRVDPGYAKWSITFERTATAEQQEEVFIKEALHAWRSLHGLPDHDPDKVH